MTLFGLSAGLAAVVLQVVTAVHSGPSASMRGSPAVVPPARDAKESLLALSEEELARRIESDLASLGSLSIGTPSSAILINGVPLPLDPRWEVAPLADSWATEETIDAVKTAVGRVHELFPDTPPIYIGDISDSDGGRLKRHDTHQAGRDVDFGFYYKGGKGTWYTPGTAATLDLPRNWALVRALLLCTDVETILLDTRVQKLLYGYAVGISEDRAWLDRVFQFSKGSKDAVICHVPLHRTHYHVRFYNRVAQELGRRAYPRLIELKKIKPPVFTVPHVVRPGETLGHLAARYGTSIRAIQQANGLASMMIRAGRSYRIPLKGVSAPIGNPLVVPVRKLAPSTPAAMASADWPTPLSLYADKIAELASAAPWLGSLMRRL